MKTTEEEVASPVTGDTCRARVGACDCGCQLFVVFQIIGQDHPHLQCAECRTSYCQGGQCKEPE